MELSFESGESSLSVRRFNVREAISRLWAVSVWARCTDPSVDLGALVGKRASLRAASELANTTLCGERVWAGICAHAAQLGIDTEGLSTYHVEIVPTLWGLTQRTNHRIFQRLSIPEMADEILDEWKITR